MGLLYISDQSTQQSLKYLPNRVSYQLFFAQESSAKDKMLKNVEIVAHCYNTLDTTRIDYSYEYDADGLPTVHRGTYKNVTRRYVPTPFGGSVMLISSHNSADGRTMGFLFN